MLSQLEVAQKQWGGSNHVIDAWLKERQELLVSYCELAGLPPYSQRESALPKAIEIKRFCQILLDYISAGHFEIFNDIVARCQTKGFLSKQKAEAIYPLINKSTDFALQFNDKYAEASQASSMTDFDKNLSILGTLLEERFALEDQLIEILHKDHI